MRRTETGTDGIREQVEFNFPEEENSISLFTTPEKSTDQDASAEQLSNLRELIANINEPSQAVETTAPTPETQTIQTAEEDEWDLLSDEEKQEKKAEEARKKFKGRNFVYKLLHPYQTFQHYQYDMNRYTYSQFDGITSKFNKKSEPSKFLRAINKLNRRWDPRTWFRKKRIKE